MTQRNRRNCNMQLGSIEIKLMSWQTERNTIASNMLLTSGPLLIAETLDAEKAQVLIDMLQLHIQNIKLNELDIIAQLSKAAA